MVPLFGFLGMFLGWMMALVSIFLILLVLVQRGRGGGLTGALGGPGGQSAFGSKAGDLFTKITSVTALIWIGFCAVATATLGEPPLSAEDVTEDNIPAMESRDPDDAPALDFPDPLDPDVSAEATDQTDMDALRGGLEAAPDGEADADGEADTDGEAGAEPESPAGEATEAAGSGPDESPAPESGS